MQCLPFPNALPSFLNNGNAYSMQCVQISPAFTIFCLHIAFTMPPKNNSVLPLFSPKIGLNRFLVLPITYFFGQNFYFMTKSVSRWVDGAGKKIFENRPKIGDFRPKFENFGPLFKKIQKAFFPLDFWVLGLNRQWKGVTFRECKKILRQNSFRYKFSSPKSDNFGCTTLWSNFFFKIQKFLNFIMLTAPAAHFLLAKFFSKIS